MSIWDHNNELILSLDRQNDFDTFERQAIQIHQIVVSDKSIIVASFPHDSTTCNFTLIWRVIYSFNSG